MPHVPGHAHHPPLTAHPHQIGVQEFASYALVIDARSGARFDEDHLPGAVSIPMNRRGGAAAGRSTAMRLRELVSTLAPGSAVLLYAHAGERMLDAPAAWLRDQGFAVDVLAGGWLSYRRWVRAALETLPRMFDFRVLSAASAGAAPAVFDTLLQLGEQVLDLREVESPSQAAFESKLVDLLRHRETDRRLWVEASPLPGARPTIPPALGDALRAAPATMLDARCIEPAEIRRAVQRLLLALDQSKP